ncbi:MAG: hypothetical protein E7021_02060 [Alphaproteobacteria bacterium]|nr:hypothetical protein [Alphaproteobacteria bacterium]
MQNKTFLKTLFVISFLTVPAWAMTIDTTVPPKTEAPQPDVSKSLGLTDIDLSNKKTVDFSARTSMDELELTTLPGVGETNITGPAPFSESVGDNDYPSEQLLGRLNPDVFEEMAELERDNAFLKLQIQKAQMTNDLENLRATYRQNRLDEIAKREDVIRTRIQWWQEQEKLRLEAEKQRQEAEELKAQRQEAEALKEQLAEAQRAVQEAQAQAQAQAQQQVQLVPEAVVVDETTDADLEPIVTHPSYVLVDVKGTRGNLQARVKNTASNQITTVRTGENLLGEIVTAVTPDSVILLRDNAEYVITF